ncbi:MAG: TNT domain-containing protein [Gammaproteobacteria bacterium]
MIPGARVDRYGRDAGRFLAPEGTPIPMRALPPGTTDRTYSVFEVTKPLQVNKGWRNCPSLRTAGPWDTIRN